MFSTSKSTDHHRDTTEFIGLLTDHGTQFTDITTLLSTISGIVTNSDSTLISIDSRITSTNEILTETNTNLDDVNTNLESLSTKTDTQNNLLTSIDTSSTTANSHLANVNTALSTISTNTNIANTSLTTLNTSQGTTNTYLNGLSSTLNAISTDTSSLVTGQASSDTILQSIVDSIYSTSKPTMDGVGFKVSDSYSGTTGITYGGYRYTTKLLATTCATAYLNSEKTVVPKLTSGQFINVPTANVTLNMSSSSSLDVGVQVIFQYYDSSYTQHYALFILNGQTAVSGINPFDTNSAASQGYRFTNGIVVYSPFTTIGAITYGDLYLYPSGTTISSGVPTSLANCLATGFLGEGLLNSGYISVPPNYQFFPTEVVISTNTAGKTTDLQVNFYTQTGNTSGWRRLAKLNVSSNTNTVSLHQTAFTDISTDFSGTLGSDMLVTVMRKSGTTNDSDVSISVYMSGYAATPV